MVATKKKFAMIQVTAKTRDKLKELAGNIPIIRYLEYLIDSLPVIAAEDADVSVRKPSEGGKLLNTWEPAFLGKNPSEDAVDNFRELADRRGEVLRSYDYEFEDRYMTGHEKIVDIHPDLIRDSRMGHRTNKKWRKDHAQEILDFYKSHCPEATIRRFRIKRRYLAVVLFELAGIPSLKQYQAEK